MEHFNPSLGQTIKSNFVDTLREVTKATPDQIKKEMWHVEGIIKTRSNEKFKFDLNPLQKVNNEIGKGGYFNSKADKTVFEMKHKWIIVDIKELHKYLKEKNIKKVSLDELLLHLDWNITLYK